MIFSTNGQASNRNRFHIDSLALRFVGLRLHNVLNGPRTRSGGLNGLNDWNYPSPSGPGLFTQAFRLIAR